MKKFFLIILVSVIIFSLALFVFIKSPSFLRIAVNCINAHTSLHIEIGSLSILEGRRVIIKDLLIEDKNKDGFRLNSPSVELQATLKGLIRKNIEEIILTKPQLTFVYKNNEKGRTSLPFTFNKISVTDADVTVKTEGAKTFNIGSINVSLNKRPGEKNAKLTGSARISELNSTVSLTAEIDTEKFEVINARLSASPADLEHLAASPLFSSLKEISIKGVAECSIDAERALGARGNKINWKAAIVAQGLSFHSKSLNFEPREKPLELSAHGSYAFGWNKVELETLTTRLADSEMITLRGTVGEIFSGNPVMDLKSQSKIPVQEIKEIISGPTVKWLDETNMPGAFINADLAVTGRFKSPEIRGAISAHGEKVIWKSLSLHSFAMRLPFEYRDKHLAVKEASVSAAEASYVSPADKDISKYRLQNAKLLLPHFVYEAPIIRAEDFQVTADRAVVSLDKKDYAANAVSLKGTIDGHLKAQSVRISNLLLYTDLVKNISGELSFSQGNPAVADLSLNYDGLDVEKLSQTFFHDLLARKGISLKGKGTLKAALKAAIPEDSAPHITGTAYLNFLNGGFSNSDGTVVAEGIDLKASNNFEFALPFDHADFTLNAEATGFELLAGKFYAAFKNKALNFSAKGAYNAANDALHINESKIGLTDIGAVLFSGRVSELKKTPLFDIGFQLDIPLNREAYNFFIRETFQEELPFLSGLEVDGKSSVKLKVLGTQDHLSARGELNIAGMNILSGENKSVKDLNVHLPLDINYPQGALDRKKAEFGFLRMKELMWAGVKLKDIEAFPSVWQNTIFFKKDINLPIMGGNIALKNFSYGDILSPQKQMRLSIDIQDLDLDKTSVAFNLPKFSGTLSGTIPTVSFSDSGIHTDGEIILKLFDGEMKANNLSVDNVFSPVASFKADVEFKDIDLGKLTGAFDFGHVSGIIRGYVKDLVIVKGQAEGFTASLESYKKKDLEQKINVEALRKISILGAGSSSSLLDRGIYQLFKEYRYEKLGFRAFLKNDKLLLLGIENEGDKGYLVKGGLLPPKVNVISYTQNISFQDMVERLKRVKQAGE